MTFYDFQMKSITGESIDFERYRDTVVLVVNTASECGFTPQLEGLEALYTQYRDERFVVLGFPCNQFGGQDPNDDAHIQQFCERQYGVTFPMFSKIDVNGEGEAPLYTWLKSERGGLFGDAIKWNFTKFLLDRQGRVVKRYAPQTKPEKIEEDIQALL